MTEMKEFCALTKCPVCRSASNGGRAANHPATLWAQRGAEESHCRPPVILTRSVPKPIREIVLHLPRPPLQTKQTGVAKQGAAAGGGGGGGGGRGGRTCT